jgi:hypothetical protein
MSYLSLRVLLPDIGIFLNRICVPDRRSKQIKNSIDEIQASDGGQVERGNPKRRQQAIAAVLAVNTSGVDRGPMPRQINYWIE